MTITNKVSSKSLMPGITPVPDVVDAPTIGTATGTNDGSLSASVAFTPAVTGGAATSFTAISTPGSITGSAASSPITVSGLTDSTSYTFKVYGTNASGAWSSVLSAASNSITSTDPSATFFIQRVAGTGSSGTITFSGIPQTYKHLQIRFIGRTTNAQDQTNSIQLRFNSDSGSNYSRHWLKGTGAAASAGGTANYTSVTIDSAIRENSSGTNVMGVGIIDIHDYASTTKNKTVRAFAGADDNDTTGEIGLSSGLWMNTNAVTTIELISNAGSFTAASSFAIYGIKG